MEDAKRNLRIAGMERELAELDERRARIKAFVESKAWEKVEGDDKALVLAQHAAMSAYARVLGIRVARAIRADADGRKAAEAPARKFMSVGDWKRGRRGR